jgi:DNA-directed RNA polymerase alpha subunit
MSDISLREHYIGQAIAGLTANPAISYSNEEYACRARCIADAALQDLCNMQDIAAAEREEQPVDDGTGRSIRVLGLGVRAFNALAGTFSDRFPAIKTIAELILMPVTELLCRRNLGWATVCEIDVKLDVAGYHRIHGQEGLDAVNKYPRDAYRISKWKEQAVKAGALTKVIKGQTNACPPS